MRMPTTVINFVEGTPHAGQAPGPGQPPTTTLAQAQDRRLGVALSTMGSQFEALLDVTLVYPDGVPTFWQLPVAGRGRGGARAAAPHSARPVRWRPP